MSYSAELSKISNSHLLSNINEFSQQLIYDLDSNTTNRNVRISQELHTLKEDNGDSYFNNHMRTVMSQPTQPPLPILNDIPYQNIVAVNEPVGSCISEEAVIAPIAGSSATVAQDVSPCLVDVNTTTSTANQAENDWINIDKLITDIVGTAQVSNEHTEEHFPELTNINNGPYHHVSSLITNDNNSIYKLIDEMDTEEFEIRGGMNGSEFSPESEIWNYYNSGSVADDKENRPNNANVQQPSAHEENFENMNEIVGPQKAFRNNSNNIILPLAESNIAQKHNIKSVYKCDPCNKTFTAKCYFTQHNNSIHSNLKLCKCHICGKRYANADELNKHLIRHSGDKPQKCPMCNKSFNYTGDLKRHMHAHFGTKPHACEICGKGFVRKDHMMKHMETHKKRTGRFCPSNSSIIL